MGSASTATRWTGPRRPSGPGHSSAKPSSCPRMECWRSTCTATWPAYGDRPWKNPAGWGAIVLRQQSCLRGPVAGATCRVAKAARVGRPMLLIWYSK